MLALFPVLEEQMQALQVVTVLVLPEAWVVA
ncbi:hypothetical protein P608_18435 [Comamonas thiooxydans]|uniref:Uncharacterized protein n=1 Tax=Comamonas thiooxydans TaxID=363952 RepID=A0A0E3BQI3_9BURK|nr:hypothetical protein P608_18435 [Comamonas thiooxydans]KGH14364.1 hypothetical protein P607_22865 [Comamonas thiooxydans]